MVAMQASEPVRAASSGTGSPSVLILQSNSIGSADQTTLTNTPNVASAATDLDASPNFGNFVGFGAYVFRADARPSVSGNINGIEGYARGTGVGVLGDGSGGIGVQGAAATGLGASFGGGVAPLRLVPGPLASSALTSTGHHEGELYVTSDHLLFFFDGTHWRQMLLAPLPGTTPTLPNGPARGTPPPVSGAARAGTQEVTATPGMPPAPSARP
jgi:hypothetical protein